MRHLYVPLMKALGRNLTLKTLFLLALTLAKRVGELHVLSVEVPLFRGLALPSLCFSSASWTKPRSPLHQMRDSINFEYLLPGIFLPVIQMSWGCSALFEEDEAIPARLQTPLHFYGSE